MSAEYFSTPEKIDALQAAAVRWVGTPFVAHSMVRGAGVDCVHLAAALYLETGLFRDFVTPGYSLDGGQHNEDSAVLKWIESKAGQFLKTDQPKPGDALCFKFGKSEHHVGVMLQGKYFIHAPIRRKVVMGTLTDPVYARTLTAVFRPMEATA